MANRIIRDSCKTSKSLDHISAEAERLFWRLITVADDFGRFEAEPVLLLAKCFPLRVKIYDLTDISKWYAELESCKHVQTYVSNGQLYGFFVSWGKHQQTRAKASKYPDPNKCLQPQADSLVYVDEAPSADVSECEHVLTNVPPFSPNQTAGSEVFSINPNPKRGKLITGRARKTIFFSDDARNLALQLKAGILENNPAARISDSQLIAWTREADLMFRRDGRDPKDSAELMAWAQHDVVTPRNHSDWQGWASVILSMAKFRQQYDHLSLKAQADPQKPPRSQLPYPTDSAPGKTPPPASTPALCASCGQLQSWHIRNNNGNSLANDRYHCENFVSAIAP